MVADTLSRPSSASSASIDDVVQVPGLNPFKEFLSGSVPSCQIHLVSAVQPLSSALSIDFSVLSSLQLTCLETPALLSNPSLWVVSMPYGESSVLCDLSTGSPQTLVPVSLHRKICYAIHNLSHSGVLPTRRLVLRAFVWYNTP